MKYHLEHWKKQLWLITQSPQISGFYLKNGDWEVTSWVALSVKVVRSISENTGSLSFP